jgi:type I restriction enzyme S subunit
MSSHERWQRVKFGDVVQNVNEAVPDPVADGLCRAVGLEHLDPGELAITRWASTEDGLTFTRRFRAGQVLYGRRRVYQRKTAVPQFDGVCSGDIYVLEPTSGALLSEFLPFVVQSEPFHENALRTSAGSLSPRTKWTDLAKYEFELPPIDVQREIAELMWSVEHARVRIAGLIEQLNRIGQFVLERETEQGDYPQVLLRDLLTGITAGRSLPGAGRPARDTELGVLKVSAVGANGFAPEENKALLDQAAFLPGYSVRRGDLLMTRANTRELVGRACIAGRDAPHLMLSDKTLRLDPDASLVRPVFLLACLLSKPIRRQIESVATGTGGAMKNISQAKIKLLRVVAPPLDVQDRILASAMESEIAARQADWQRQRTTQLRNAFLTQLSR